MGAAAESALRSTLQCRGEASTATGEVLSDGADDSARQMPHAAEGWRFDWIRKGGVSTGVRVSGRRPSTVPAVEAGTCLSCGETRRGRVRAVDVGIVGGSRIGSHSTSAPAAVTTTTDQIDGFSSEQGPWPRRARRLHGYARPASTPPSPATPAPPVPPQIPMLKSLEFENFKSWGGRHRLEFGRITGLFGANSTGKSSIIQLLLMLKQTVESTDSNAVVNFGGRTSDYADLGSFLDIVTDHSSLNSISYDLNWTQNAKPTIEMNLASVLRSIPGPRGEQVVFERLHYSNYTRPSEKDIGTDWQDTDFVPIIFDGRYGKIVGPIAFTAARSASGKYDVDVHIQTNLALKAEHESTEYGPIGMHRFSRKTLL